MQKSRVAMVTGAGGALGAAIARSLVAEQHRVVLTDQDRGALEVIAGELGSAAFPLAFDVADATEVESACAAVRSKWGPVDILVNNAGVLSNKKIVDTSPEEWRRIQAVNLDGPYLLC